MKKYSSLEQIREDKQKSLDKMDRGVERLKSDVRDCFLPSNSIFFESSNKYMKYLGYAISAYKTATNVKGIVNFFKKIF